MILQALLLAAAIHVPAGRVGGSYWTDYIPAEPGKSYRFRLQLVESPKNEICVRTQLYDEDRYPISASTPSYNFKPGWPTNKNYFAQVEPTAETRYMRFLFAMPDKVELNIPGWSLEEGKPTKVTPSEPTWRESPWCIVVPNRESPPIELAAQELQHWMKEIGGERALVVKGQPTAGKKAIFLGRDFLKKDTGRFDSWLITKKGGNIHLAANQDEGVVNAVYDLLERNTDLIFARSASNAGTVFTKTEGIRFDNCESHVVPAFAVRAYGMTGRFSDVPTRVYQRRNFCNDAGWGSNKFDYRIACERWFIRKSLSYEFGRLIPNDRYYEAHPEFYGMKEGKRQKYEHYGFQPCYTCAAGQREMAKNLKAAIEREWVPGIARVDVGYGDTWSLCTCPDCVKPVKLPSGRVLTQDDDAFRSYQFYKFAFAVIAEAQKAHPEVEFNVGGYLYAAVPPPELEFPKNVSVTFCPYPKCCRVPVYDDAKNKRWHDRSEAWAKSNAIVDIYEYYGNAMGSARPGSDMAQKDLVYWSKLGFSGKMYAEQPADVRWKEPADDPAGQWDFGLMENWVMTRLFVDPTRDVEKLRDEFCRRAYHEGAPMMRKFFAAIRSEWFADSNYQGWEEEATYSLARYVRAKGRVEEMRGLLVKAEAAAQHPNAKALIGQTLKRYDWVIGVLKAKNPDPEVIPFKGKTLDTKVGNTLFKAWHDNHFLYVAFDAAGTVVAKEEKSTVERFPSGSAAGVVVDPRGGGIYNYYHFLTTPTGRKYDARAYDLYWNSDGFKTQAKRTEKGWRGLLQIPLGDVGVNPTVPKTIGLNFVAEPLQYGTHRYDWFKSYNLEVK